jgi:hypothetical protein
VLHLYLLYSTEKLYLYLYSAEELAHRKPAWQSSTFIEPLKPNPFPYNASLALDGNENPKFTMNTCTHTALHGSDNPWWAVDLLAVYQIKQVSIKNRLDCCRKCFRNHQIVPVTVIKVRLTSNWQDK